MKPELQQVLNAALALPPDDRETIAELLWLSLDGRDGNGVDLAWQEEIERRVREIRDGTATLVPWEEVCDALLERKRAAK